MRPFVLILTLFAAPAPAADNSLQAALAKIDQASAGFKGMTAEVTKLSRITVINEDTIDKGTIKVKKMKPHDIRILFDIREPDPKQYSMSGNKGEVFYPKRNEVEEYDINAQQRSFVHQLMFVGFGNAADLTSAYSVQYGGNETVAGQKTVRLDLTPKSKDLLQHFPKVVLWISEDSGLPVQQKLIQPSGDYSMATYSNIKLAPNLSDAEVRINPPKNAKRIHPNQ
jgi:outer membrane lipoprotein-sorting protein